MRLLALLLLLQGCANQWMPMDCEQSDAVQTATIHWVRTADPNKTCTSLGSVTMLRGGACIQCAGSLCTMWAEDPRIVNEMTLGHEVRHAFGCKHG